MDTSFLTEDGWHRIQINKRDLDSAIEWCEAKFGPRWIISRNRDGGWRCFWTGRTGRSSYNFEFKNEEDAMMFILRWS